MKWLLKYLFVLFMSVGIFFLTTDIDSFILRIDKQVNIQVIDNKTTESQGCTDSVHHIAEDLFVVNNCIRNISDSMILGKTGFIAPKIEFKFATQIWQPPKYS
jgi:hypothetical protein